MPMQGKTLLGSALAASLLLFGATAQAQGQGVHPRGDIDRDGILNMHDRDRDGDGIPNHRDPNPNVRNVARVDLGPTGDLDRDGVQNRRDRDRDGDGVANVRDRYPDQRSRS